VGDLGLLPSEFYSLTPNDFWFLVRAKCPKIFKNEGVDYEALYALLG